MPSALDVLQRLEYLLEDKRPWFDAVRQWYAKSNLPRRVIADLLRRDASAEQVVVLVNHESLRGPSQVTDARGRRITWLLPSNLLKPGDNAVVVQVVREAPGSLPVRAASIEQDYLIPWQTVGLSVPRPAPTGHLGLTGADHATHQGRHWSVDRGGILQFTLRLEYAAPVNFTLQLDEGSAGIWLRLWRDVEDEIRKVVTDAVKDKLWQIKDQLEEAWRQRDPRSQMLQDDLQALEAYLRLDRIQLRPAFRGPEDTTLEEIINRTGNPDALIRDLFRGGSAMPAEEPPMVLPAPRRPPPTSYEPAPVRPLPTPGGPPPMPRPRGGSSGTGLGCCLGILVVLAALGVAGYFAWREGSIEKWLRQALGPADTDAKAIDDLVRNQKAGKGDVQVTLYWNNKNDLDLHVVPPSGEAEEIYYKHPVSSCGGKLDVDANRDYATATAPAIENVYWPEGKAPSGAYKVYVVHFHNPNQPDTHDPTTYKVRVVVRGQTQFFKGEISHRADPQQNKQFICEFEAK
jgi:hypothetical protein